MKLAGALGARNWNWSWWACCCCAGRGCSRAALELELDYSIYSVKVILRRVCHLPPDSLQNGDFRADYWKLLSAEGIESALKRKFNNMQRHGSVRAQNCRTSRAVAFFPSVRITPSHVWPLFFQLIRSKTQANSIEGDVNQKHSPANELR